MGQPPEWFKEAMTSAMKKDHEDSHRKAWEAGAARARQDVVILVVGVFFFGFIVAAIIFNRSSLQRNA